MKEQLTFMTGMFDTTASVPPVTNDHHFGEDLAKWLAGKSKGTEFTFGTPAPSDTGWTEPVIANGEKFTLGFDLAPASVGSDYAEWLITIDKSASWRSVGSTSRGRLCDHIHNVLRDERQIREVSWD